MIYRVLKGNENKAYSRDAELDTNAAAHGRID